MFTNDDDVDDADSINDGQTGHDNSPSALRPRWDKNHLHNSRVYFVHAFTALQQKAFAQLRALGRWIKVGSGPFVQFLEFSLVGTCMQSFSFLCPAVSEKMFTDADDYKQAMIIANLTLCPDELNKIHIFFNCSAGNHIRNQLKISYAHLEVLISRKIHRSSIFRDVYYLLPEYHMANLVTRRDSKGRYWNYLKYILNLILKI